MPQPLTEGYTRRRAGLTLFGIAAVTAGLITILIAVVIAGVDSAPTATRPAPVAPRSEDRAAAAENELAARPMLQLPAQAAQPQAMTTQTAGPAITLPPPTQTAGRWIPGGFPATPEGAVAQLKALDETALRGGDPQAYARAYRELSLPGAPPPESVDLFVELTHFRSHAGLPDTGAVAGLEVTYHVTHGLVKGSLGGRYTVVCVLGELAAAYEGRTISGGLGDCQAMRWTPGGWQISPGALAATATSAWPGSADAVNAGYRELT